MMEISVQDLGLCGHFKPDRELLAVDAFGGVVWCTMCGAASTNGGETWQLPRIKSARQAKLAQKETAWFERGCCPGGLLVPSSQTTGICTVCGIES